MMKSLFLIASLFVLQGCAALVVGGVVVGTAAKVAVETAKVPVKATGVAIDAVTEDDEEEEDD